jgi:hypothetical protein
MERAQRARDNPGYVQWVRDEVCHSLQGEQAGYVPPPENALNVHKAKAMPVLPYADPTLSPFGTWVARFLMDVEAYAFLYKQHVLLLKLLMGCFDVAREASNGQIHYSSILAGPNSTSKSYVFTIIEDLLIKGTVSRATRRTENAFTYNKDQGCRVLIDHEMPGDFFGDCSDTRRGARTSQTKEVLTSHEANTESCQMIDGQRTMISSRSRAHLCYLAATNDWSVGQTSKGDSCRDGALISRFDVVFPTQGHVGKKSIVSLMAADRDPSGPERAGKQNLIGWISALQQANYWVHRCIHLGAIRSIDMGAVHAVVAQYPTRLEPRTIERIIIMARQFCIVTAIMTHYGFDASPRKGQVICPEHISELEPLLVITAEQAKFALGLFEADLCNRIQAPFARALKALAFRPDPDLGFNYVRVQGCETANQLADELLMQMPEGADVTRDLITQHMARLRQTTLTCQPYTPQIGAPNGMAKQGGDEQQYFAMRGLSFHLETVQDTPAEQAPLEENVQKHCHVGPPCREITPACVPGHAHLLCVREVSGAMPAYTQQGMYMPAEATNILGAASTAMLEQGHRAHSEMTVTCPVEVAELKRRGGWNPDFAHVSHQRSEIRAFRYPDEYLAAYQTGQKRRLETQ